MAAVGLIESLLTLQLVDGLVDDGTQGSTSSECLGQGLANVASGLTGGMGGCALIGQTLININSGGTSRLAGVLMSFFLGGSIIACAPLLAGVPVATLVGLMFVVSYSTFSWSSLRVIKKIPATDAVVVVLTSIVTVWKNLALAVVAGTILSALNFAWQQSQRVTVMSYTSDMRHADALCCEVGEVVEDSKTYHINGYIFFGSSSNFQRSFDPKNDPRELARIYLVCVHAQTSVTTWLAVVTASQASWLWTSWRLACLITQVCRLSTKYALATVPRTKQSS